MSTSFELSVLSNMSVAPTDRDDSKNYALVDVRQLFAGLFDLLVLDRRLQDQTDGIINTNTNRSSKFNRTSTQQIGYTDARELEHENALRERNLYETEVDQAQLLVEIRDDIHKMSEFITSGQLSLGGGGTESPGLLSDLPDIPGFPGGPDTPTKGSRLRRLLSSPKAMIVGGAAIAVGTGAYIAHSVSQDSIKARDTDLINLEAQRRNNEITEQEYQQKVNEIAITRQEYKGGAIGAGAGTIAGAGLGAKAGAKLGTILGPKGVIAGAVIGGSIGAISGSSVGQNIGGAIGLGAARVRSFFGFKQKTADEINSKLQKLSPTDLTTFNQEYVKVHNDIEKKFKAQLESGELTKDDVAQLATVKTYEKHKDLFKNIQPGTPDTISQIAPSGIKTNFSNIKPIANIPSIQVQPPISQPSTIPVDSGKQTIPPLDSHFPVDHKPLMDSDEVREAKRLAMADKQMIFPMDNHLPLDSHFPADHKPLMDSDEVREAKRLAMADKQVIFPADRKPLMDSDEVREAKQLAMADKQVIFPADRKPLMDSDEVRKAKRLAMADKQAIFPMDNHLPIDHKPLMDSDEVREAKRLAMADKQAIFPIDQPTPVSRDEIVYPSRVITEVEPIINKNIEELARIILQHTTSVNKNISAIAAGASARGADRIIQPPFTNAIHNKERTVVDILSNYR